MQPSPLLILEYFHYPPKNVNVTHLLLVTLHVPAFFPALANHQFTFWLQICLFWTFHTSGIIHYVVLCDCLLSLSIMFSRIIRALVGTKTVRVVGDSGCERIHKEKKVQRKNLYAWPLDMNNGVGIAWGCWVEVGKGGRIRRTVIA